MAKSLVFRPVTEADKWNVHSWRNTQKVRDAMVSQHVIQEVEHDVWWNKKMDDPTFKMLLLEEDGTAKAVQIFFDIKSDGSAWWAFYFTPHAPEEMGDMLKFWKSTELAGLSYAFDTLCRERLICEVLRSNSGVLNWHKRFGFKPCNPSVSANAVDFDLEVMDFEREQYLSLRDKRWSEDLRNIEFMA